MADMYLKTTWRMLFPKNGNASIVVGLEKELPSPNNNPINAIKATGSINVFPSSWKNPPKAILFFPFDIKVTSYVIVLLT